VGRGALHARADRHASDLAVVSGLAQDGADPSRRGAPTKIPSGKPSPYAPVGGKEVAGGAEGTDAEPEGVARARSSLSVVLPATAPSAAPFVGPGTSPSGQHIEADSSSRPIDSTGSCRASSFLL